MPIKLTNSPFKIAGPTTKQVIQEMVTNYKTDLKAKGDEAIKTAFPARGTAGGQSSSIWISVNEIMQLITDNRANGIRVYFGQHNQNSVPTDKAEYEKLLTLIFVATRDTTDFSNPTHVNSEDQLNESADSDKANSISVAGPFEGQGADSVPICDPHCPKGGFMKIII